jgi:hypothetical protein
MSKVAITGNASGAGVFTIASPNSATDQTLTMLDGTGTLALFGTGTAVATTSGTAHDFTEIPSWAKRITVMFNGVSTTGTNPYQIQLGAGSVDAASYVTSCTSIQSALSSSQSGTTGFYITTTANMGAASTLNGSVIFSLISSNTWAGLGSLSRGAGDNTMFFVAGTKALSGTLDRLRITTAAGTETFDAGSINIMYE